MDYSTSITCTREVDTMILHQEFTHSEVVAMQAEELYMAVLRNAVKPNPLARVFYGRNGVKVVYAR